jgi:hypothetical protein
VGRRVSRGAEGSFLLFGRCGQSALLDLDLLLLLGECELLLMLLELLLC